MFSILMTSLTDKPLILQWEVWLRSLLGLKGLKEAEKHCNLFTSYSTKSNIDEIEKQTALK